MHHQLPLPQAQPRTPHISHYKKHACQGNPRVHNAVTAYGPVPVVNFYGPDPLHRFNPPNETDWEVEKIVKDFSKFAVRSDHYVENGALVVKNLVFMSRQGTFVSYSDGSVTVYGKTPQRVANAGLRLIKHYSKPRPEGVGTYCLLSNTREGIETEEVELSPCNLKEEMLPLHYGEDFPEWNREFLKSLQKSKSGLSILEGPPGNGKTTWIRYIIQELRQTHRFYYVPPSHAGVLANPDFIGFWAQEQRDFREKRLVMILEDSEPVLLSRGQDNHPEVSALLNATDGLLSDFLKIQILCTINRPSSEIDPALLRPGRLLAHRNFPRIPTQRAKKIADKLGIPLPNEEERKDDYSLAEIFNSSQPLHKNVVTEKKISGFASTSR
jgi:hypothetical protein